MAQFTVRLRNGAIGDIGRIRTWYRKIDPVLEDRFVADLNQGLERIGSTPFAYHVRHLNTRQVSLRKFPYAVFYVVDGSRIVVLAVIHHKRDSALAQGVSE
jgi:toxin ParE1/3/4